ncbi:SRPBCC family protein [Lutibacter flavus]|uniref:Uncharacterized conserved protein YndB, AHSA1/START domain n=1 Tax=Lutibacter flavus TaxID=691689 RepID=A0A238X0Z9_9FLAO|nr:SRPBCC domain-containing protein [Lutibacter flavus]SNR52273.1 Uncharacterized conserved protein YndB, AHSA1/START domain [Lutibacter flavus]
MKVNEIISVEQQFNLPADRIWNAITNINEMKQWFFSNIESFKPEVGFKTEFKVNSQDRIFTHLWKITEVEPFVKIVYNWKYDTYPGDSFVHFELFKKEHSTILKVTSKVIESFPKNVPEFKSESCREGWNYFIKKNLKNYLENKEY